MRKEASQRKDIARVVRTDFVIPTSNPNKPATLSFAFGPTGRRAAESPVQFLDFEFEKSGLEVSPEAAIEAMLRARSRRQAEQIVRKANSNHVSTTTRQLLKQRVVIERSPATAVLLADLLNQSKEIIIGSVSGAGIGSTVMAAALYPVGRLYFAAVEGMSKAVKHAVQIRLGKKLAPKRKKKKKMLR